MASRISLLSDEEIRKIAAFDLTSSLDLYDPRFGSTGSMHFSCPTCGMHEDQCVGHQASLSLGQHIFHPLAYKSAESTINSKCMSCSSAFTETSKSKTKKCTRCGATNYCDYRIRATTPEAAYRTERDRSLKPEEVSHILPKGYVISSVLVPPVHLRTPDDIEWSSKLQKLYEQLIKAVRLPSLRNIPLSFAKVVGSTRSEGILGLVSGKDGIFRKIMLGKRVELSARAVISPDPNIMLDEVSIPEAVASVIRVDVRCNRYNVGALAELAHKGKLWWMNYDEKASPRHVVSGMIFRREVVDGDLVLLNRQPSLSRSSMMSFRVRLRRDSNMTFGINPQVVSPFNADFDGDEMNLFFMCSVSGRTEMLELCHLSKNVTDLVPVQDLVTGSYMMSRSDEPIGLSVWQDCMMYLSGSHKETPAHTTHALLRSCIPKYDGSLLTKGAIIDILSRLEGDVVLDFLHTLQLVVGRWMSSEGLTVPLNSVVAKERVYFDNDPEEFRDRCFDIVNRELDSAQIMHMIRSGAKGSMMHAAHMAVALGQQYIRGGEGVFCKSSYSRGLTPNEFFGHQMAAREGVVSTGVSTAMTGYLNRRACKVLADLKVQYNGTIGDGYCTSSF